MKKYLVEIIMAVVFIVILMVYNNFVTPGDKMTKQEVDGFISKIDAGLKMAEPTRTEFINRVKTWALADDGEPVYLANIFHENSAEEVKQSVWEGLDIEVEGDGHASHEVYLEVVKKLIIPKGIWPAIGTETQGVGSDKTNLAGFYPGFDEWTEININRYPSRRSIMELFSDPVYLEVMPYKLIGLRLLTVPTTLRFQFPDLRLAMGTIFLIIILIVGWVRELRRNRKLTKA